MPMIAVAALGTALAPATAATAALAPAFVYSGSAYGTSVNVSNTVTSGPSALVTLGCTSQSGAHRENTTVGANVGSLLHSASVKSTVDTFASPTKMSSSSTVQNLSLLNGLVQATAVRGQSNTTKTAAGFQSDSAGSTFVSLTIAGAPHAATAPPNSFVFLAGYGYLVLNQQFATTTLTAQHYYVTAIHLVINQTNVLGIPVGTNVIVGRAVSGLSGPVVSTVGGFSYGTSANLPGNVLTSGPSFIASVPCEGTNNVEVVNTGAGINIPNVLVSGTIRDTAKGTVNATIASAETTSTVDSTNVLAGLVNATVIKADAHAGKTAADVITLGDGGSQFATLTVSGFPLINANVGPNTSVSIAGLGTLWLHRVIRTSTSIEVRMIELVVNQSNSRGLPIGTDIRVAVAYAAIK